MNLKKSLTVFRKEILYTLRDKKTIVVMFILPIVLYPLLFILTSQLLISSSKKMTDEKSFIAYRNDIPEILKQMLEGNNKIQIKSVEDPQKELKERKINAYFEYAEIGMVKNVKVYFDSSDERCIIAKERITEVVEKYKRKLQEEILQSQNVDIKVLDLIETEERNTASSEKMGGKFLSFIIPMMLIMSTILGAFYPAIEFTAVEKERGTLETILSIPVTKNELFFGKYLAVCVITIITALLNLISILLVYSYNMNQLKFIENVDMTVALSSETVIIMLILIIPLACFISAAMMSVCLFAKSFKDAQNIATPVYMVFMLPSIVTVIPGISLDSIVAYIPVVNVCVAYKAVLMYEYSLKALSIVLFINLVFAFIGYMLVLKLFNAEEVLFAEGKGFNILSKRSDIKASKQLEPSDAFVIMSIVLVLIIYIGSYIQMKSLYLGLLGTLWGIIFLSVVFSVWYFKLDIKSALFIKKIGITDLIVVLIIALGTTWLNLLISEMVMWFYPDMPDEVKEMQKLFDVNNIPVWMMFLVVAVSPAICEELFFRGILLSSLKEKFSFSATIIIVALLFGLYHLSLLKLIPITILGAIITYAVLRSRSIFSGMIIHFINNSVGIILSVNNDLANKIDYYFSNSTMMCFMFISSVIIIGIGIFVLEKRKVIFGN